MKEIEIIKNIIIAALSIGYVFWIAWIIETSNYFNVVTFETAIVALLVCISIVVAFSLAIIKIWKFIDW